MRLRQWNVNFRKLILLIIYLIKIFQFKACIWKTQLTFKMYIQATWGDKTREGKVNRQLNLGKETLSEKRNLIGKGKFWKTTQIIFPFLFPTQGDKDNTCSFMKMSRRQKVSARNKAV